MSVTTISNFVVVVLLKGRKDPIVSPSFDSEEAAQQSLDAISAVQGTNDPIKLDWLRMKGLTVEAAYIEDRSTSFGVI